MSSFFIGTLNVNLEELKQKPDTSDYSKAG